ncbi:N-acetyltransferase [Kribbella pittospori]|uniref:N-acetyltransferase n=1 Tax=Kribbella pittospori TaxID=722689 RepID=A0A4R0KY30_9ACTN|nr:N-acetyltransferase [Kribbella pittospori]TCC61075.1 N-acetyltransferase [Kribbella pittospori]
MSITWNTRAETPADADTVRDITLQAFGRQFEVDYLDTLRLDPIANLLRLSLLATTPDDQPVAYALLTRAYIGDTPILSLSPVAAHPAYQRQGAGSAAVTAALDTARDRGEQTVVVLGHDTYYPRFGFRQATEFGIHHPQYDGPNLMALALGDQQPPTGHLKLPVTT